MSSPTSYYFRSGMRRHAVRGRAGEFVTFWCGRGGSVSGGELTESRVEANCGLCLREERRDRLRVHEREPETAA